MKSIPALMLPERYIDRSAVLACYSGLQAGWAGVLIGRVASVSKLQESCLGASLRITDGVGNVLDAVVGTANPDSVVQGARFAYAGRVELEEKKRVFLCFELAKRYVGRVEPQYRSSSNASRYFSRLTPEEWEAAKRLAIHHIHFELGSGLPELLSVRSNQVDIVLSRILQDLHYPENPVAGGAAKSRASRILKAISHEKAQLGQLLAR